MHGKHGKKRYHERPGRGRGHKAYVEDSPAGKCSRHVSGKKKALVTKTFGQPACQKGGAHHTYGVHGKDEAEALHGKAVDVLEHKGRGRDIGKKASHGEALHAGVAKVRPLSEKPSGVRKGCENPALHALILRQGFGQEEEGRKRQNHPDACKHPEDAAPACPAAEKAASHRPQDGGYAVNCHEQRNVLRELRAVEDVAANGPCEHCPSGAPEALQKAQNNEACAILGLGAEEGSHCVEHKREHEHTVAPPAVGYGPHKELAQGQAQKAGGDARLSKDSGNAQIRRYVRQSGQIHVRAQGSEGREPGQKEGSTGKAQAVLFLYGCSGKGHGILRDFFWISS